MEHEILERLLAFVRGTPRGDAFEWWLVENRPELEQAIGASFVAELLEIDFIKSGWRPRLERTLLENTRIRELAWSPHPAAKRFTADVPILTDALEAEIHNWGLKGAGLLLQLSALGRAVATIQMSDRDLRTTAGIIEQLLVSDDQAMADAAATGFIEAYVHHAQAKAGARPPTAWFGPKAQDYIEAWDRFCGIEPE